MTKDTSVQIWDSIGYDSTDYLDREYNNIVPELLEFLINSLLSEDEIDIGIFSKGKQKGSIVTYDFFISDKNLCLKLMPDNSFELELMMFDNDGNEKLYIRKLSEEEVITIPDRLRILMKEVLNERESRAFNISTLLN